MRHRRGGVCVDRVFSGPVVPRGFRDHRHRADRHRQPARPRKPGAEKSAPYECGFEAFEDARMRFDVRYYLIAILFIIFDLEIAFVFPWATVFGKLGMLGLVEMGMFLLLLVIGFVYVWKKGALEWE
jgi:NADH-quinone oxidoreductase subunit A